MNSHPMHDSLMAPCGLDCRQCPGYQATQANDQAAAEATARAWSEAYGTDVRAEHVWCDGCKTSGRKGAHCGECAMRACALGRALDSCAACADYPCETLAVFFPYAPEAMARLDLWHAETR